MGQRGGVSQEQAQADESAGSLLHRPFRLLWCPPLPRGESVGLSSPGGSKSDITRHRKCGVNAAIMNHTTELQI